jgi:hypothetical protein
VSRNRLPKSANWRRPIPDEDPVTARLMAMVAALTSELSILRERLDTVERLAEQAGLFTQAEIEAYAPGTEAAAARDALRRRGIQKVFKPLLDDAEREARIAERGSLSER